MSSLGVLVGRISAVRPLAAFAVAVYAAFLLPVEAGGFRISGATGANHIGYPHATKGWSRMNLEFEPARPRHWNLRRPLPGG